MQTETPVPLTVESLKAEIAKQAAKPRARHRVAEYRQTGSADALLYEVRRKQERAVEWRKKLIETIEAEGPMTQEASRLILGKLRSIGVMLYRVNGEPRFYRVRGRSELCRVERHYHKFKV